VGRVRALVAGARRIADPSSELGRRARAELVLATGLSPEGVELALGECLETRVSEAEIDAFCAGVEPAPAAHVLLSANVFVAAHRAVALALAASARVRVRPSRREPAFAGLLAEAAPGLFDIVASLAPDPGDAMFAYGTDETLAAVRASLPPGVAFHAHGSGIGVAVVDARHGTRETARALALDVVPFDQRGCLSPRAVVFVGTDAEANAYAELVARELALFAEKIPLGTLGEDEAADTTRFREAITVAGLAVAAGPGWVGVGARDALVVAPVGRNLAVAPSGAPEALLTAHGASIAALGLSVSPELERELRAALPLARPSPLGSMQRPPFDGPVDRRKPAFVT
jgi:hypothetical protein